MAVVGIPFARHESKEARRRDLRGWVWIAVPDSVPGRPGLVANIIDIVAKNALHKAWLSFPASTVVTARLQLVDTRSPARCCGRVGQLHSPLVKPMDLDSLALTGCLLANALHARLIGVTDRHPHLARLAWLDTSMDAAIHRQWPVSMESRSRPEHPAHLLCEMDQRLQVMGQTGGLSFDLPLTQPAEGDLPGPSTVQVNRQIWEMRSDGLVEPAQFPDENPRPGRALSQGGARSSIPEVALWGGLGFCAAGALGIFLPLDALVSRVVHRCS